MPLTPAELRARSLAKRLYSLQQDLTEETNPAIAKNLTEAVANLTRTIKGEGLSADVAVELNRMRGEIAEALAMYANTR